MPCPVKGRSRVGKNLTVLASSLHLVVLMANMDYLNSHLHPVLAVVGYELVYQK